MRNLGAFMLTRLYLALLNFYKTGRVYPKVFPDPVLSLARTSLPASISLKVSSCTGNILVMPCWCNLLSIPLSVTNSANSLLSAASPSCGYPAGSAEKQYLI